MTYVAGAYYPIDTYGPTTIWPAPGVESRMLQAPAGLGQESQPMSIYNPAGYPRGVPNPYGARVHAWHGGALNEGTRYHGPVYGRPMATFPWHERPLWTGGHGPLQDVRGLGTVIIPNSIDTNTIWMAQAFLNEELRKLGIPTVRMDGVLDKATCQGMLAVLASVQGGGTVDPAFADFMRQNGSLFDNPCQTILTTGGGTVTSSVPPQPVPDKGLPAPPGPRPVPTSDDFAMEQCIINFGDQSDVIANIQQQINAKLTEEGYESIPVSGQWDGKTCGAIFFLKGRFSPEPVPPCPYYEVPLECPEVVDPKKKGAVKVGWIFGGLAAAALVAAGVAVTKGRG